MPFFKVCLTNEISTKKPKKISLNGEEILIAKSTDDRYFAFTNTCSHEEKPLENGKWDAEKCEMTCPFHKAVFAIANQGAVVAPPAFVSLQIYPVEIKTEGGQEFIYVEVDI